MKNLTLPLLRSSVLPLALLSAVLFGGSNASGTINLSIADSIGDPNKISITPGSTFTITLRLTASQEQLIGASYKFAAPGAGSGKFTLVTRDVTGTIFTDLQTQNVANTLVTSSPTADLGSGLENILAPAQPGDYFLANYTIAAAPNLAPGTYLFETTGATAGIALPGPNFTSTNVSPSTYQVTVVPEPGTAALAMSGLGLVAGLVRRRKPGAAS